jgi:hypothetical protein
MADPVHTDEQPIHLSAVEARGGEIILRTRARRITFLAGLVGIVLLALVLGLLAIR